MLKRREFALLLAVFAFTASVSGAEPPDQPEKYYKLDFIVKEIDGSKVVASRSYSMFVSSGKSSGNSSIRTGSRVPILSGASQYQYIDLGVSIDCRSVKDMPNEISMTLAADISSVLHDTQSPATAAPAPPPIVRQNKWNSVVLLPLKKATVVFSSDDATTNRQMQLEVTATPIQ